MDDVNEVLKKIIMPACIQKNMEEHLRHSLVEPTAQRWVNGPFVPNEIVTKTCFLCTLHRWTHLILHRLNQSNVEKCHEFKKLIIKTCKLYFFCQREKVVLFLLEGERFNFVLTISGTGAGAPSPLESATADI